MEEIEYLEEYEDFILPKTLHYLEDLPADENVDDLLNEPQNDFNPTFSSNAPEYDDSQCPTEPLPSRKKSNLVQILNTEVLKTPAQFQNFFIDSPTISSFPKTSETQQPSPSLRYETSNVSFLDRISTHNPVLQRQEKYKNVATVKPNLQRPLSSIIEPFDSTGMKTQTTSNTDCAPDLDVNISKEDTTFLNLEVEKHCVDDYNLEFHLDTEEISDICSESMNFSDEYDDDILNLDPLLSSEDITKKKLKRKNIQGTESEVNPKKSKHGSRVISSKKIRKAGAPNVNNFASTNQKQLDNTEKKKNHSNGKKSKLVVKKNGKKFVFLDRSKFSLKNRNSSNNSKNETQGSITTESPQIQSNNVVEKDNDTSAFANNPEKTLPEKREDIKSPLSNSGITLSSKDSNNIALAKASIGNNEKVIFSSPKNMKRISQPIDCDTTIHGSVATPTKSTGLTFGTFSLKSIKPPSSLQIKDTTPKHFSFQPQTEQKLSPQPVCKDSLPTERKPENEMSQSIDESRNCIGISKETSSSEKDIDDILQKENDVQNLLAPRETNEKANEEQVSNLKNKLELVPAEENVSDSSISKNDNSLEKTPSQLCKSAKVVNHPNHSEERDQSPQTPKSVSDSSICKNNNLVVKTVTKTENLSREEKTNAKNINHTDFSTTNGLEDLSKENISRKPNVPNKDQLLQAPTNIVDTPINKNDISPTKTLKTTTNKEDAKETDCSIENTLQVFSEENKILEPSVPNKDQLVKSPKNILENFASKDDIHPEKNSKKLPYNKKENRIVKKLCELERSIEKSLENISKERNCGKASIENEDQLLRTAENFLKNSFSKTDNPMEKTIQKSPQSRKENKSAKKNIDTDSSAVEKSSENFSDEKIFVKDNFPKTPLSEKTANKEKTPILQCNFELRQFDIRLSKNIVAKLMQTAKTQMSPKTSKNISKKEISRDILGSINNVVNSTCAPAEKSEISLTDLPVNNETKIKGRKGKKKKKIQPVQSLHSTRKVLPLNVPDGISSEVKEASIQKSPSPLDRGKKKSLQSQMPKLINESVSNLTDEKQFEEEVTVKKSSAGLHKEINSLSLPSIPNLTKENISKQPSSSSGIGSEGKEEGFHKLSSVAAEERKSLRQMPVLRRDIHSNRRCISNTNSFGVKEPNVQKSANIIEKESNILAASMIKDKVKTRGVRQLSRKTTRQTAFKSKEISQPKTSEVAPVPSPNLVKERNLIMRKEPKAIKTPAALTDDCLSKEKNVESNKNTKSPPFDDTIIVEPKKEVDEETLVPQCKTTNLLIHHSLLDSGNKIKSSQSPDTSINKSLSDLNVCPNLLDSFVNEQSIPKCNIFELPAYIVMKTKIISRKDLESNKRPVPPVIKQRADSESENTPTETIVKTERPEFNTICAKINSLLEQNANYLKFASGSERLTRMNDVLADYSLSEENAKCTLKFLQSYLSSGSRDKAIRTRGQQFIPIYDSQKKIIGYRKRTIHSKPTSSRRNSRRTSKLIAQPSFSVTTVNVFRNSHGENNGEFSTKIEPELVDGGDSEMILPDASPSNVTSISIKSEEKNMEEEIAGQ